MCLSDFFWVLATGVLNVISFAVGEGVVHLKTFLCASLGV